MLLIFRPFKLSEHAWLLGRETSSDQGDEERARRSRYWNSISADGRSSGWCNREQFLAGVYLTRLVINNLSFDGVRRY